MSNLWELEEAERALLRGDTRLTLRYLDKALERVRCMYCHKALDRPHHPHFKGFVHDDCAERYDGRMDYLRQQEYVTGTGQRIANVHEPTVDCVINGCCIHAPSKHSMRNFPTHWREDRRIMERICPHGVGHPDPDDLAFRVRNGDDPKYAGVHGCDGCCAE